jgi:8-oxo-dGTP pyrophosphatase MutT (NUDIX family)
MPSRMDLADQLSAHVPADAREAGHLLEILAFVARHAQPFDRSILEGHLTASLLVVSHSADEVLLLHHRKLGRWLQPGGHAEAGETAGETVALREAREETGVLDLALHPAAPRPLDVDVHAIPARPGEPAHRHLDLRYLAVAPNDTALRRQAEEANDLRWFAWSELRTLDLDPGLRRALAKVRRLTARRARGPAIRGR